MKEIRNGINEHIVSEKMRDILLLMLNKIEENSDSIDPLARLGHGDLLSPMHTSSLIWG